MTALIAIAGRVAEPKSLGGLPHADSAVAVPSRYISALHRAGAHEAVLNPVPIDEREAGARLARFDGLLLIGGGDLDPSLYGETPHPELRGVNPDRDAFETALVRAAVNIGLPTLAVCRGFQVLNVALGGTLDQHITGREGLIDHGSSADWTTHRVNLRPGSLVAKSMGVEEAACASHHHQAIAGLGEGLAASGWAEDGVVEAVEMEDGWVVGVQWHPELTAAADPAQQALFETLARRCSMRLD